MSAFRDTLAADLDAVFLNIEEFGEEIVLNGQRLIAIVDESGQYAEKNRSGAFDRTSDIDIPQQIKVIRIAKRGLAAPLVIDRPVILDGEPWLTTNIQEEDGLLVVTLLADFSVLLAQAGEDVLWNNEDKRCFRRDTFAIKAELYNNYVHRCRYWFAAGDIEPPLVNSEVEVNGTVWMVEEVIGDHRRICVCLVRDRS